MKVSPSITPSEAQASTVVAAPGVAARPAKPRPFARRLRKWRGLLLAVVLPVAIATLYFGVLAAGQYASDARILVRGSAAPMGPISGLGAALSGAGFRTASDEALAVRDFLRSHDAVRGIAPDVNLVEIWRRPEADLLAMLWYPEPTAEQLLRYYNRMVTADYDQESAAVTLLVRTFRPEDSKAVAEALLKAAERLVNGLSQRQREDTLASARNEVTRAEARVVAAREAVTQFRQAGQGLDPTREAGGNVDILIRLEGTLTQTRAELGEKAAYMRPDNPQIVSLRNRIAALEAQIAAERLRTTAGASALPQQLAGYERLLLEREFADRQLGSATSGLEQARMEADRQQLWLSRVVQPQTAEEARFPRATYIVASLAAILLAVYGLFSLLMAGFREHAS